jgi:hypothetical protein
MAAEVIPPRRGCGELRLRGELRLNATGFNAEGMGISSYSALKDGARVTRDAVIALVISIVATAVLVSLGVV